MSARELLDDLSRRGVSIAVVGDRLRLSAPTGTITPDMRRELESQKPALIALLAPCAAASPRARPVFRFAAKDIEFGDVAAGWTPANWAVELRRKAERCEAYRPDIATYYRDWAADIEHRLGRRP